MNVGMMQREKNKEWIYSKENVTGGEWSRYTGEIYAGTNSAVGHYLAT
jgi:hypothetical protein